MQNQVDFSTPANRSAHANRNTHAHRNTDANHNTQSKRSSNAHPSYREVHNSYKKQEIGGIEDLREVSMIRQGVNITCLVCYLNSQLGEDEKLTAARLVELGLSDINDVPMADFGTLATPREMLDDLISSNVRFARDPSTTSTEVLRITMSAFLGQQYVRQVIPEIWSAHSKLEDLRNEAATIDYSGMSDSEKVMSIYNRYDEAFGDFRSAWALPYNGDSSEYSTFNKIWIQFQRELTAAFGTPEKATAAYKVAQYGNMSNADIRAEIASKYPPVGEMTLRDFKHMLWEMRQVGADDGLQYVMNAAIENTEMCSLVREELLDTPFDVNWLLGGYNTLYNSAVNQPRVIERGTSRVLEQLFGTVFDNRGFAVTNQRSPVDYTSQARILNSKYNNWTKQDFDNAILPHYQKIYDEGLIYLERIRQPVEPIEIKKILPYWLNI